MSWTVLFVLMVLAGYMAFLARLLWIAFGQPRKTTREPARAGWILTRILAGNRRDCDDDLVWQTQVPALEFLRSAGSAGASVARMKDLYGEFARAYPELCDGSNFSDWIDTLQSAAVAVQKLDTIAITVKARLLLERLGQRQFSHGVPRS